jgi:TRAP-type mannitol/chloroaromatic compound transport system permease small subunit
MNSLLKFSRLIDAISDLIGKSIIWLILASVILSAGNAIVRKIFNTSSNALLEIQWYLFAAVFMLGAGYAFLKNAHVRIDFLSNRFSARTRNWIDILGILVFLGPLCVMLITTSWPLFMNAWESGEMSQNAGGLIRWPIYLMIPVGMGLLLLQAAAELVKRVAFLRGLIPDPIGHAHAEHEGESEAEREIEEHAAHANVEVR